MRAQRARSSSARPHPKHPNARALEANVLHYLAGCENEDALSAWVAAARRSVARGEALDAFLGACATAYLRAHGEDTP